MSVSVNLKSSAPTTAAYGEYVVSSVAIITSVKSNEVEWNYTAPSESDDEGDRE